MKRIAILVSDIRRSAGTERAVVNLANSMVRLTANEVVLISLYSAPGDRPFYTVEDRVEVLHLGETFRQTRLGRVMAYGAIRNKLNGVIRAKGIHIVLGTIHAYNMMLATMGGFVRVGCEHLNYDSCPSAARRIRKLLYPRLDAVVLLTKQDAAHYDFLKPDRVRIIPNISSFAKSDRAALQNHRIIMVGRLTPQKGYDLLLDVIEPIRDRLGDWTVDIFGKGEEEQTLPEMIRERGLDKHVRLFPPTSAICREMLSASIYLMTSRNEGLPMVLIEAQTCGLPILSFDCPEGPREIVHDGQDGYLVPCFDKKQMGERLLALMNDAEKRERFGAEAFANADRFAPDAIVRAWETLFDDLHVRTTEC